MLPARPSWRARRPPCPTGCRDDRPTGGRNRTNPSTPSQQPQYYEPAPQYAQPAPAPARTGPDRTADEARRAEGPRDPDRGGVRRAEGEDPQRLASRPIHRCCSCTGLARPGCRSRCRATAPSRLPTTGSCSRSSTPPGGSPPAVPTATPRDPIADLKELAALHASSALTDAEFETAKAKLLAP